MITECIEDVSENQPKSRDINKHPLSKYEIAKIMGMRALQLSCGAQPLVPVDMARPAPERSSAAISKREFEAGLLEFTVYRSVPGSVPDSLNLRSIDCSEILSRK